MTPRRPDAPRSTPTSPGDATLRTYPHQSVLYRPGDAVQTAFLIHSGRVRLLREGRTGRPAVFAILRQGDLFGDILRPETAVADELAVASGEVTVQVLESRSLKSQLESDPSLALELLRACADQVRGLRARILGLTFQEVPARLAETLLAVAEAHGERCAHDGETDLRGITQQDLADLVGASRSFVSTLVNELKREGVLGNVGRVLCIRDQKALRRLASSET